MVKLNIYTIVVTLYVTILLDVTSKTIVEASRKFTPHLIEEEGSRRTNRPAECQFGKSLKELGSTWFADLGPPFGVMYCIKCECVSVQKKRRIIAKVQCRNIKNECPKPSCEEPILLPGRCCKTCPGDLESPDIPQDVQSPASIDEDERNMKHFAALLTGRTSQFLKRDDMKSMYTTTNSKNIIASGRFSFHKKNLYYSFYLSDRAKRPRAIQFVDNSGNILEEQNLEPPFGGPISIYQNATGKVCGVWRRVPRDYRRLLRDDQMNAVLLWNEKGETEALAGEIRKYPALATELFSSILEPRWGEGKILNDQLNGAGGTAIISTVAGSTASIHITLVFNGIFNPDDISDVPINVRLESLDKKILIIDEQEKIRKPAHDINIIEISAAVTQNDLRLLTRGRLLITVESRKNPNVLRIQGSVSTRIACELFQTLLSVPHGMSGEQQLQLYGGGGGGSVIKKSSGLAWLYMNRDGSLVYNIETENVNENSMVTLNDDSSKRKIEVQEIGRIGGLGDDGTRYKYGILDRLGPRVFETLYGHNLAINLLSINDNDNSSSSSLLRGRLTSRYIADARDSPGPTLLKRVEFNTLSTNINGMVWLAVDTDCNLHYDVSITEGHNQHFQLYLEDIPIEAPGAPVTRKLLEEFTGNNLEGFVLGPPTAELAKLETSVVYVEVYSKSKKEAVLKSKIKPLKVPGHCLPLYGTGNDVPNYQQQSENNNDNNVLVADRKCYHSGRFYDDGGQWSSSVESCTLCSCIHGRVKCDPIKCPPLRCKVGESEMLKGECCPSCTHAKHTQEIVMNTNSSLGCRLGDQFYSAGVSWHPYLPPNGFDECAVCTCDSISLEISCPRVQCPPLSCSEKEAYRPDKKACCKKCPEYKPIPVDKSAIEQGKQRDEMSKSKPKSIQEILTKGGCKTNTFIHENGHEWHPIIASHGEQKCIQCRCKDGQITCSRKRCTRSICNTSRLNNKKGVIQQQLIEQDECCSHQCRRQRRHHNNKRSRNLNDHKNIGSTKS